eukprot:GEMP01043910.1.p1 GENE.GEMP01043910.1~~GEMP01043910.1.p1  ORF type:complete len:293 (+),score=53.61 GEMP01043910.1:59-937(+)
MAFLPVTVPSHQVTRKYLLGRRLIIQAVVGFIILFLLIVAAFNVRAGTQAPYIHVAVMSAPGNIAQRKIWRACCSDALRTVGIKPVFYMGHPSHDKGGRNDHTERQFATTQEQTLATQLYEEAKAQEDLVFLPFRDNYLDLTDKTLNVFDQGCRGGAQLLVKVDDDMCVNTEPLLSTTADHVYDVGSSRMLYGGLRLHNDTHEKTAPGPHGELAPFFAGPIYLLSCNLVSVITNNYNAFSNLFAIYGNSGEDANVGKWVKKVRDDSPQYQIDYKVMKVGYDLHKGHDSCTPE